MSINEAEQRRLWMLDHFIPFPLPRPSIADVPCRGPAKPVRGDMRQPRQHRRLHDGPTLYDPETGQRQQVMARCQIGAKCTGAHN